MKSGSAANTKEPVYDYRDGFYLIRGTEYYKPFQASVPEGKKLIASTGEWVPSEPYCVCGWGDTSTKVETSLGTFYFCHSRHGHDYEAFAKKYLEDLQILMEHQKQLKLF